jgi:hypothetical protein
MHAKGWRDHIFEAHIKRNSLPKNLPCLAKGCNRVCGEGKWRTFSRHIGSHVVTEDRTEVISFVPSGLFIRSAEEAGSIIWNGRYHELNLRYETGQKR